MPTVSIITPSYNQGKYLEETIQSVISQEGNFYLEYIIMDGGSTDNSVHIIKKYETLLKNNQYPVQCKGISFYWKSEKDKGQSDAINKGLQISTGELLTYINSDDILSENIIATILSKNPDLNKNLLFYGDLEFIDPDSKTFKKYIPGNFNIQKMLTANQIGQQGVFWTRPLMNKVGMFNADYNFAFDYDMWIRCTGNCEFIYIPQVAGKIRYHAETKTSTLLYESIFDTIKTFQNFFNRQTLSPEIKKQKETILLYHCLEGMIKANHHGNFAAFSKFFKLFTQNLKTPAGITFSIKKLLKRIPRYLSNKLTALKNQSGKKEKHDT